MWARRQRTTPTAKEFAAWLDREGGKLDWADGPAYSVTGSNGSRVEKWYSKGMLNHVGGPAYSEIHPDGSRVEE